jgi:fermentation-respiration switch protein FrsA (DUF1100 family)
MEDGGTINGVHFKIPNALGVVFFLKGNSKSVKGWGKFARDYVGKGYDFFMVDYRGFGKSKGKRNEAILYSDSQYLYKWLSTKYKEEHIVILGRSFGSGVAARIASWNKPKMLILDSPYYSFNHNMKRWGFWLPISLLSRYKIPTYQFLKHVTCPINIIHGSRDTLISYKQGVKLYEENKDRATLYTISGGKHNDLPEFEQFHEYLYEILVESLEVEAEV